MSGGRALPDGGRTLRRGLGSPTLFAIVYTSVASAIYFSLGVVADRALGLTPVVFLLAGLFFVLCVMTYVEGASLHQERAGSTVFARYAFNELVSFIAGWAVLLDFLILIAVTAYSASHYMAAIWHELGEGLLALAVAIGIIVYVAVRNIMGFSTLRYRRILVLVAADLGLQILVIVLGLVLLLQPEALIDQVQLGHVPTWSNVLFALSLSTVAFTSLESASGLAGEVAVGRAGLKRLVMSAALTVCVLYVGMAVVAIAAQPVTDGQTALGGRYLQAPVLGIAAAFHEAWLRDTLRIVIGVLATVTLIAASNAGMLGLSRLAYSLATNRQIPSAVGRLHPTRATPYVVISIAAVLAIVLAATEDLEFLAGTYAFGALLAFTIAHLSIIVSRYKEPDRPRPYRMPFNVPFRGGLLPLPAVLGAAFSALAWVSVLVLHDSARFVGIAWMAAGLALYVGYRKSEDKPITKRVTVPQAALQRGESHEAEFGSILVPLMGTPLDDDIVQTAGRLASEDRVDEAEGNGGATIEALWVFEVPMALPIDARLPDAQLERARAALRRAKAVGEEYQGVQVATATVRARRAGQAIVEEARRRGVEAIVLAAEEPTRVRGGALLGGLGGGRNESFVGEVTKYVLTKAPCRVIITAPPEARTNGRGS